MITKSISALVSAALLTGCATTTTTTTSTTTTAPVAVATAPEPASLTRVFFYAQNGQSEAQQDRDRFECFNWAAEKSGFDPSRRAIPRERREQQVVPVTHPGATVIAGAVTGALIGAAVSNPWDRSEGAAIGAIAGTALGSIAASSEAKAIRTAQVQVPVRSGYEQQAAEFRRAMSACLEGRGYVVK